MGKLTKAQRKELETVLNAINRLNLLIERPEIAFCRVTELSNNVPQGPRDYRARDSHRSQHYNGPDGMEWDINFIKELTPMDKGIGSDLVARFDVKKSLERFIENNS